MHKATNQMARQRRKHRATAARQTHQAALSLKIVVLEVVAVNHQVAHEEENNGRYHGK